MAAMLTVRSLAGFPAAPSLPTSVKGKREPADAQTFPPGHQIDDFQVIALLGRGGFGAVYLAWQLSLGRQIALKVSPCIGQEGRTLARLDHPHIVRVYSEKVHEQTRLLCMQYVASIPLDELLARLAQEKPNWTGQDLLDWIDTRYDLAAEFDPEQLADRQSLSGLDHVDAVCWIGSRLADALDHAHRHGVLHRDLKPGNILVSQYGRPMLVDFNLANLVHADGTSSQLFGGTLPYMSPEHLEAFDPAVPVDAHVVTRQSDIYSLGVVLYELLTGAQPFPARSEGATLSQRLSLMVADRRQLDLIHSARSWTGWDEAPSLKTVLQKSLAPQPADRWESAQAFQQALLDVLDLRATLRKTAGVPLFARWCTEHPFIALAILGLFPHFLGSLVNIPYNLLRVVRPGGKERLDVFLDLANVYNLLVYPLCIGLSIWLVKPVFGWWVRRELPARDDPLAWLRRRVLNFPRLAMGIALLGWLPGAIWFPWGLNHWAGELSWGEIFHLQTSVAISGLIALTYSALGVACLSICVLYPRLWIDPTNFRQLARTEVEPLRRLLRLIPFLAGAIPLAGACLAIFTSDEHLQGRELGWFKFLTIGLIVFGMIGFQRALKVSGLARQAVDAFAGTQD